MNITRQLQSRLNQVTQLLDSRPDTERALIFVTASLVIYILIFVALLSPLEKSGITIQKSIDTKQAEKILLEQELLILAESLRQAPKESQLARLEELRNELNNSGKFSELIEDLISPREMVRFVDSVLSKNKGITVVRANNMAAVQLWPIPQSNAADGTAEAIPSENHQQSSFKDEFTIYKHGLSLKVKGSYRELVTFLATLEQLPWKILWGDINLSTEEDDDAVITLVLYTLSPDNAWMGL